ncbi:MAG: hypothetical protein HY929_03700 [Euryarchaeota archaeon]|nr:hypothetical protein [Euryarchaeota archaeon]
MKNQIFEALGSTLVAGLYVGVGQGVDRNDTTEVARRVELIEKIYPAILLLSRILTISFAVSIFIPLNSFSSNRCLSPDTI